MECNKPFRFAFADAVVLKEELHAIGVGNVTTGEPGSDVKVTLRRDGNTFVFDFVIPRGQDGFGTNPDGAISETSQNAVENRVIKAYVDEAVSQLQDMLQEEIGFLSADMEELADYTQTLGDVERIEMTALHTAETLLPGKLYVFPEMASLDITLGGELDPTVVQEYRFRFTSGATPTTLTLPSDVEGEVSIEANKIYEVSILDGYLVSQSWEVV
jgi:hypothetical protein